MTYPPLFSLHNSVPRPPVFRFYFPNHPGTREILDISSQERAKKMKTYQRSLETTRNEHLSGGVIGEGRAYRQKRDTHGVREILDIPSQERTQKMKDQQRSSRTVTNRTSTLGGYRRRQKGTNRRQTYGSVSERRYTQTQDQRRKIFFCDLSNLNPDGFT